MKRTEYLASLTVTIGDSEETIYYAVRVVYAFNSGIRASEALAREYARAGGILLNGDTPKRTDDVYMRLWRSGATQAMAMVRPRPETFPLCQGCGHPLDASHLGSCYGSGL